LASLAELNGRLKEPVTMARFRPNLVLSGLEAHGEDHLDEIRFETPEGVVRLKLVKPCTRCAIPNVNPLTGELGTEPGDTLSSYRADARLDGAITFAMNAVIVEGIECGLRVGQVGRASYKFD
ncbi:MAG TPA: MOSC domain-containing protein, partial [Rhizobacter sp.]|nr:MOSC domain-containing protein [Rhizobacter sp.]